MGIFGLLVIILEQQEKSQVELLKNILKNKAIHPPNKLSGFLAFVKYKKGQISLEYLMTCGIAFLIMVIAMMGLYSLGAFDLESKENNNFLNIAGCSNFCNYFNVTEEIFFDQTTGECVCCGYGDILGKNCSCRTFFLVD